MVVTFEGISAVVSDVQLKKQSRGIVVNEGFVGNTTVSREEQPSKALFCSVVIDDGSVMDSSAVQALKQ